MIIQFLYKFSTQVQYPQGSRNTLAEYIEGILLFFYLFTALLIFSVMEIWNAQFANLKWK